MGLLLVSLGKQRSAGKGNFDRIGESDKEIISHITTLRAVGFIN